MERGIITRDEGYLWRRKDEGKYNEWHKYWCVSLLSDVMNNKDWSSDLLYRIFWLDYIYCDNIWYEYKNNYWQPINEKELFNGRWNKVFDFLSLLNEEIHSLGVKFYIKIGSKINEAIVDFISEIIEEKVRYNKELRLLFETDVVFNNNYNIYNFKNGTLEKNASYTLFRESYPEDYIDYCIPINYYEDKIEPRDENLKIIIEKLRQVFVRCPDIKRKGLMIEGNYEILKIIRLFESMPHIVIYTNCENVKDEDYVLNIYFKYSDVKYEEINLEKIIKLITF